MGMPIWPIWRMAMWRYTKHALPHFSLFSFSANSSAYFFLSLLVPVSRRHHRRCLRWTSQIETRKITSSSSSSSSSRSSVAVTFIKFALANGSSAIRQFHHRAGSSLNWRYGESLASAKSRCLSSTIESCVHTNAYAAPSIVRRTLVVDRKGERDRYKQTFASTSASVSEQTNNSDSHSVANTVHPYSQKWARARTKWTECVLCAHIYVWCTTIRCECIVFLSRFSFSFFFCGLTSLPLAMHTRSHRLVRIL